MNIMARVTELSLEIADLKARVASLEAESALGDADAPQDNADVEGAFVSFDEPTGAEAAQQLELEAEIERISRDGMEDDVNPGLFLREDA